MDEGQIKNNKHPVSVTEKLNCMICSLDYIKTDIVTSCSQKNISLHSFHLECLNLIQKYQCSFSDCPYCGQILHFPLKKYTIY